MDIKLPIFYIPKKKEKEPELLPLYIEAIPPTEQSAPKENQEEERGVIIIEII